MALRKDIMNLFQANPHILYKISDIQRRLQLDRKSRTEIQAILADLEQEGKINHYRNHRFGFVQETNLVTGTISITKKGFGFVRIETPKAQDSPSQNVFIQRRHLGGALHGDRVVARIINEDSENPEGKMVKILQRAHPEIVAQFYFERKGGRAVPRDSRIDRIIQIPRLNFKKELKDGIWVLIHILDFGDPQTPMLGEIKEILGSEKESGIDILVLIRDYGVKPEFPEEIIREAESLPQAIPQEEIEKRKDFRAIATFTIDPETAKDFDDALSIEILDQGRFRLGVHIADVAHYVRMGTVIDGEARARATSIYPVDRVIPMLPERLSNNLCSLRQNEDRLCMSVIMDVDAEGNIHHSEFHNSIIRSRYRLNYTEVQSMLDHSDPWISSQYAPIRKELFALKELSENLIRMRERKGALDLDIGETDVVFDSNGLVMDVRRHPRLQSHRIVEQCMILANEAVATKIHRLRIPSLYRIHEPPAQHKLHKLAFFLAEYGIHLPMKRSITPQRLQAALAQIEEMGKAGPILRRVFLRSMMRAQYSHENKGHYGLASSCYTHFTSPIRRYPDLVVHRVLKDILSGKLKDSSQREEWYDLLPDWASHCTDQEGRSEAIERESTNIKGLEFMEQFLGKEFEGIISGVANFGLFVELERYPLEGMIPVGSLGRDYFIFDENALTLVGRKSGGKFRFGDPVLVKIERIDIFKQEMDLALVK